jgi:hypothetical protein
MLLFNDNGYLHTFYFLSRIYTLNNQHFSVHQKWRGNMRFLFTIVSYMLLLPMLLLAATTGRISGKVTDLQTGEPLVGANVLVVGTSFGAATDLNGEYTINNLDAGVYTLKVSYLGYKTVTITDVRVNSELSTRINVQLPPTGVAVGAVEIVAQRPLVNASNTNAIRTTTNEVIDALPVRGVANIVSLTPGVVLQEGNIYIRGGRQDEVGYYLEGSNITNPVSSFYGGTQHAAQQVTIPQDALEEIQVQAGGYTAEFGGANAGIIRTDLKSGGPNLKASLQYLTDNWTFKSSKDRYNGVKNLGTYSYGYNDLTATVSGPLFGEHIKAFGLFDNLSQADMNPEQVDGFHLGTMTDPITGDVVNLNYPGGPMPGNNSFQYSGVGTFTFDYNPTIVRLIGTYTFLRQRVGASTYTMFDNNRLPIRDVRNGDFGIKLTEILSKNVYFEVNGSYIFNKGETYDPQLGSNFLAYGDSVANYNAGVPWYKANVPGYGLYQVPRPYELFSTFSFASPNMPLIGADQNYSIMNYSKYENDNLNLNASLSADINKQNSLKIGGELQIMTVRSYTPSGAITNFAQLINSSPGTSLLSLFIKRGVNNYGYDVYGNTYSGSSDYSKGQIAPYRPVFGGAYIQDRIEYKNLILNAGIRFDYINTDNTTLKDPSNPQTVFNTSSGAIDSAQNLVKVPSFSSISPRLGFSFPITDQTIFHAQYGKFVQQPSLSNLYEGIYSFGYWTNPNNGFFQLTPVGTNLRPERTTQYEIGFTQQIGNIASFDITAYYKDITGQVVFGVQSVSTASGWRPYSVLVNGDYATTEGVELSFNMRRTERFLVNGSVSFSNAEGTGDNPFSDAGEFGAPVNPNYVYIPQYIVPLSYNHALTGNINIDYRFGKDDGPSALHQLGASLLFTFASGHPYTLGITNGQYATATTNPNQPIVIDPRNRTALEALNSSVTPSTFELDFRIDKTFDISDNLSANIFIQVLNILNTQNVEDVFSNTGSATTDGYLTIPSLGGYKQVQNYGQQFVNAYQALNIEYAGLYGTPRQIRLGLRLEY